MKSFRIFAALSGLVLTALAAQAQGFAPANIGNTTFYGTITASTGGANGAGTVTEYFTSSGQDFTVGTGGMLSDPAPYTYTKTGANTANVVEPIAGTNQNVTIAMTFTSAAGGNFTATYANNGATQAGTFTITAVPFGAPLSNMSNRVVLGAGQTTICGWVVAGSGTRRVLVRAVGPGLTQFGVGGAIANPTLTIFSSSTAVVTNDDWNSDPVVVAAMTKVGAFGLTTGSRDSAVVVTIGPGTYTAVVKGVAATDVGDVLIETYYIDDK